MSIKNFIGDVLGYARCPVTNDTYWGQKIAIVHYSENHGIAVSARALKTVPAEDIAKVVLEKGEEGGRNADRERLFTMEEILAQIPDRCLILPNI